MNAIAWDPNSDDHNGPEGYKGHFIDLFGGIKDIKDKIVRCVLYPETRFSEDALRISYYESHQVFHSS